ncbi:putative ascorbate peroxidase [Watersipora subatra]|uniref:putative ascorbate peroxidase n=1 Tax=Watersipora subatra TaxID=2589382 RepID=UPI00355B9339
MSQMVHLLLLFAAILVQVSIVSAQQGIIISSDDFFARNPQNPRSTRNPRVAPSTRLIPSNRNRVRDPSKPTRCTRRQIRNGRCTPTPQLTTTQSQFIRPSIGTQRPQPTGNIELIRGDIQRFINEDHEMIPNLLQLVFHTCMGGCDGCINFNDRANRGLRQTFQTVREFWSSRASVLTLADMIVLMATEAIEVGMAKEGGPGEVDIAFRRGRTTCDNPDNYNKELSFPHGDDIDDIEILQREFGLSRKLAIALLGAHSVGRCHLENTGFAGRWDNTELTLDNHYYKSLVGTNWKSTMVEGQHQWNATNSDNSRMMLNSDLALLKSFTFNNNGRPSCRSAKACDDSPDATQVKIYGRNDQLWSEDFIEAFLQMVNQGL